MSEFVKHTDCQCGSSDGLAIYEDHEHCFVCGHHRNYREGKSIISESTHRKASERAVRPLPQGHLPAIPARGLRDVAVNKFKVTVNTNPESPVEHVYPYFDADGTHVANKIRLKGKEGFPWEGDVKAAGLFGQQAFPAGGRAITITEGELDALSAYQLSGDRYPAVSVKSSSAAKSDVASQFEYLNSFEKVVIAFDNDEAGQKAAVECANLFELGKVFILKLSKGKDANDYARNGWAKEYIDEWFRAPQYKPDGIKIGRDMWDEIINHQVPKSVPYPLNGLNHMTYGIRKSELVTVTAETGVGKTSVLKEIEYSLLMNPELIEANEGVGFLHFEEPNYDTVIGLMSIHSSKPYHLPDVERSEDELRKAYNDVICNDRVVIWDHFGSNTIDAVLAKIRHMAALGCRYIVVDHLSIIVSDQSGDERKQLDEISTKLKTLCMNLNIAVICVIHQNRQGQIRGTAGVEQLSNIVMKLHRDKTDADPWRRNVTKIVVEKNRFCGRTGPAAYVWYNETTGRLEELTPELAKRYEEGGNNAGLEF